MEMYEKSSYVDLKRQSTVKKKGEKKMEKRNTYDYV